jgi:hypothetical protein
VAGRYWETDIEPQLIPSYAALVAVGDHWLNRYVDPPQLKRCDAIGPVTWVLDAGSGTGEFHVALVTLASGQTF